MIVKLFFNYCSDNISILFAVVKDVVEEPKALRYSEYHLCVRIALQLSRERLSFKSENA